MGADQEGVSPEFFLNHEEKGPVKKNKGVSFSNKRFPITFFVPE